jgi:hypothetical protein
VEDSVFEYGSFACSALGACWRSQSKPCQESIPRLLAAAAFLLHQAIPDIVLTVCDSSRQFAEQTEGRAIAVIKTRHPYRVGIEACAMAGRRM